MWVGFDRALADVENSWPDLDHVGGVRPNLGEARHTFAGVCQAWPELDQTWAMLPNFDPRLTNIEPVWESTKFGPSSIEFGARFRPICGLIVWAGVTRIWIDCSQIWAEIPNLLADVGQVGGRCSTKCPGRLRPHLVRHVHHI